MTGCRRRGCPGTARPEFETCSLECSKFSLFLECARSRTKNTDHLNALDLVEKQFDQYVKSVLTDRAIRSLMSGSNR